MYSTPSILSIGSAICISVFIGHLVWQWMRLSHIPGPFMVKFTNIPRAYWVWSRKAHDIHIDLHEKYGNLVRFGPNTVSLGSPLEIDKIYRMHNPLLKSNFYHVILPMSKGKVLPGLFATQDENLHRMLKKPIAGVYSMSSLTSYESLVDMTIEVFLEQLKSRFVETGRICDWGLWLQYFAFDVVGEITFSKRLGFLERGEDVDGIMAAIWHWFEYVAVVGQIPWVDYLWVKNPVLSRLRPSKWSPMVQFAMKQQNEREAQIAQGTPVSTRDFLSRFLAAMQKDTSIPPWALPAWTSSNILAGSDTTAIMLRTIFKNLIEHPDTLKHLRRELDDAQAAGNLSHDIVTWKESLQLPYLDACIKEAGRLHPPFGLNLERIVPAGGLVLSGQHIPADTVVGMNAWVVHRDRDTFGEDANKWRPERWIEGDSANIKKMEAALLTFGAGHRTCLGKHISLLEIHKLVPTVIQKFDIVPIDRKRIWEVQNRWFVPQWNFNVYLSERKEQLK